MANRIKQVIRDLVSYNQIAFIKDRSIGENILLAQEMLRKIFKYRKGKAFVSKWILGKLLISFIGILFLTL